MKTNHFGSARGFAAASLLLGIGLSASPFGLQGPGELAVAPTRILIEGRERAAELVLANRGTAPATYRLSLVEMRMMPDGSLQRLPAGETSPVSAKPLLRYSPRQVTIEPGTTQRVRISVSRPPDLSAGEYRSHLLFEALPNAAPALAASDPQTLSIRFHVIGAVSLPIVVRHGRLSAEAQLGGLKLGQGVLEASLFRKGSRSIRGDLTAFFEPKGSTQRRKIGFCRELALYVPNLERSVRMPIAPPPGLPLRSGRIVLVFEESPGVKDRVRTSSELALPD